MQLLFDLFPVIAFFVTFKLADIFVATGVLIAAVIAQTAIQWLRHRTVSRVALGSAALVLVFGGLTLAVRDQTFIQWKMSVFNWLLALVLLGSHFVGERPLTERMLGEHIKLERSAWLRMSWSWIAFLVVMGALNLFIAYNFSTDVWMGFKLGAVILTFVYMFGTLWVALRGQPQTE
jgi:intracellular septation protein